MPTVSVAASARDALVAALTSPARAAVVVDAAGRHLGVVTLHAIAAALAPQGPWAQTSSAETPAGPGRAERGSKGGEG
jgi:hypothetical protein